MNAFYGRHNCIFFSDIYKTEMFYDICPVLICSRIMTDKVFNCWNSPDRKFFYVRVGGVEKGFG